MHPLYITVNIIFVLFVLWSIYVTKDEEKRDVELLNSYYDDIEKNNKKCLDYLQTITQIPTWRFSIYYSAFYTSILFALYYLSGSEISEKICFGFWILFFFNAFFMYKFIAIRDFHYICRNGCNPSWNKYS